MTSPDPDAGARSGAVRPRFSPDADALALPSISPDLFDVAARTVADEAAALGAAAGVVEVVLAAGAAQAGAAGAADAR